MKIKNTLFYLGAGLNILGLGTMIVSKFVGNNDVLEDDNDFEIDEEISDEAE